MNPFVCVINIFFLAVRTNKTILLSSFLSIVFVFLIGCKKETPKTLVNTPIDADTILVAKVKSKTKAKSKSKSSKKVYKWENPYKQYPTALAQAMNTLNISQQEAIELMEPTNKIAFTSDANEKVFNTIVNNSFLLEDYTPEKDEQIKNMFNGLGVYHHILVAPNFEGFYSFSYGNYFFMKIFESYTTHNFTLAWFIYDPIVNKAYILNGELIDCIPIDIDPKILNKLKQEIIIE